MADANSNADFILARLKQLQDSRGQFIQALTAPNTQRGYGYDWAAFARFCEGMGLQSMPAAAESVSLYILDALNRGHKVSTVTRRVAAVVYVHKAREEPSPVTEEVRSIMAGARRLRNEQRRQVRPLSVEHVRAIAELLIAEDTPLAMRNRAIVVVGLASALRSANLATLTLADAEFTERGVVLRIGRSKTDQEGKGRLVGLPAGEHPATCPVGALRDWIARRGTFAGPLFTRFDRQSQSNRALQPERIGQIVQQCVARIGLDAKQYGSHSLRAGFVTAAGEGGAGELLIAAQTGHRDLGVLRSYFRRTDVFRVNAAGMIGL
jgi:site-specific recombinase XerD